MSLPTPPFERRGTDDDGFDGKRRAPQHFADPVEDASGKLPDHEEVDVASFVLRPSRERAEDIDRVDF